MVPIAWIRLRLGNVPLGRDEGEYAYSGQLLLDGVPPYVQAYNMKFPGTYYAYAVIMWIFGQTPWAIRVGLMVVNFATALILFAIGRRVTDRLTAAASVAAFLVLSLDRWIQGTFAHATHFALLPAMGGMLLLQQASETRRMSRLLAAGTLFTIAALMKQQAALFILFALWFICRTGAPDWRRILREVGWLTIGAAAPFALLGLVFAAQGILGRFLFWTFGYATEYVLMVSLGDGWRALVQGIRDITRATLPFWLLAVVGAVLLWTNRWSRTTREFLAIFLVVSFLAVCPGLYFRTHYFILILPAASLCIGVAVTSLSRYLDRTTRRRVAVPMVMAMLVAVSSAYVAQEWRYLFTLDDATISRDIYGANPFVEAPDIARYIREHTQPGERIAVLGSEPEIYFLAHRPSATGYIYTYPLMEPQRYASQMQDEMMTEIESARPKYLVAVLVSTSWLGRPTSDHRILSWAQRYAENCYDEVGVADIRASGTFFRWDSEVARYQPQSEYQVHTFRRRSDAPCTAPR